MEIELHEITARDAVAGHMNNLTKIATALNFGLDDIVEIEKGVK